MWALIDGAGRVCEFFTAYPGAWPLPQRIVDVSQVPGIAENWIMAPDGTFSPPPDAAPVEAQQRARRDAALAASDWTQISDAPLTRPQRQAWAAYRTALRALPAQPDWPAVTWPAPPA